MKQIPNRDGVNSSKSGRSVRTVALLVLGVVVLGGAILLNARRPRTEARRPAPGDPVEARHRALIGGSPQDPRQRLALIAYLLDARRNYDALDEAREAQRRFPDSLPVHSALAEAQLATAHLPEAIETLRPFAAVSPTERIQLAYLLLRNGEREAAMRHLGSLPLKTLSPDLLSRTAKLWQDVLRPDRAVPIFRLAVAGRPSDPSLRTSLGLALLTVGKYAEAVKVLGEAAHASPSAAETQLYLGTALRLSGDLSRLPEAAEHLRRATELRPEDGIAYYELALAQVQLRDLEPARVAMARAASLAPGIPEIQRDQARILKLSGDALPAALAEARYLRLLDDPAGALRVLKPWQGGEPAQVEAELEYASALYAKGDFPGAAAALNDLRRRVPSDPEVVWALFRQHRERQQWKEAIAALDDLERMRPDDLTVLEERANLFHGLARYPEQEKLLLLLRERDADNPVRDYRWGQFLTFWSQRPDRYAEAEKSLRRVLAQRPDQAEVHYVLGAALEASGRPREAIPELRSALDVSPELRDALRSLGRAYQKVGDRARADDAFMLLRRFQERADEQTRLQTPVEQFVDLRRNRKVLAKFLMKHGSLPGAIVQLEAAEHGFPEDREVQALLVDFYGHARRFQRQFEVREKRAGRGRKAK